MDNIKFLLKRLNNIEKELQKCRYATSITHGFGTSRLAKKQAKTEALAKEKYLIIEELTNELGYDFWCDGNCPWCDGAQNCKYPFLG